MTQTIPANHTCLICSISKAREILDLTTDNKLTFNTHQVNLIQDTNQQLHALRRLKRYDQNGAFSSSIKLQQLAIHVLVANFYKNVNNIHENYLSLTVNYCLDFE